MKKTTLLILLIASINILNAQVNAVDDTFSIRDTIVDYTVLPLLNDDTQNNTKIEAAFEVFNTGAIISVIGPDSTSIHISDTSSNKDTIRIQYNLRNDLNQFDTAFVILYKIQLPNEVYSGDCGNDGVVNHLDILSIGVNFGKSGSPRHNLDTNNNFYSKQVGDWSETINGINIKFSDVDGNGIIEKKDITGINSNYNQAHAPYNPTLSPSSNTTFISSSINNDTLGTTKLKDTFKIPINIINPDKISAYGIGYSYNIEYQDKNTGNLLPLTQFSHNDNELWSKHLSINKHIGDTQEVAYCRIDKNDSDIDSYIGIAEIVIEVVVVGITNPGDITELYLNIFDIALIDKDFNYLPISPQKTKIYLKNTNAKASINSNTNGQILFNYNRTDDKILISGSNIKNNQLSLYNIIGQEILSQKLNSKIVSICTNDIPNGIYFVKLDGKSSVFKFIK